MVAAGDDELRKRGRGKVVQRDLRLPGAALDDQGPSSLRQLGWERRWRVEGGADGTEEAAQECLRILRRPFGPP